MRPVNTGQFHVYSLYEGLGIWGNGDAEGMKHYFSLVTVRTYLLAKRPRAHTLGHRKTVH